jgi:hypothetical protein
MTIISFQYNFIFIKLRKVAGTSIEIDLSKIVESNAIVTPITPSMNGHIPRNYQNNSIFYNHMPATEIRAALGAQQYDSMFKFCVEREPVSKCISHFHMLRNSGTHNKNGAYQKNWDAYCNDADFPIDLGMYSENKSGKDCLLVDRILKYENLHNQLSVVLENLGLPNFKLLTKAKSEYALDCLIRDTDVTPNQRRHVYSKFGRTLSLLNGPPHFFQYYE